MSATDQLCTTCTANGRRGYCARLRCYCGHDTCHAAESYYEPAPQDAESIRAARIAADVAGAGDDPETED